MPLFNILRIISAMNIITKRYVNIIFVSLSMSVAARNVHAAAEERVLPSFRETFSRYIASSENALFHAAAVGDAHKVYSLIYLQECDPSQRTADGFTALHYAALSGKIEVIRVLLRAGAKVNAESRNCVTPLHCAVGQGYADVAQLLLDAGAHMDIVMSSGIWGDVTSMQLAKMHGYNEIVSMLEKVADVRLQETLKRSSRGKRKVR
jgi:ankyrin